ncbi:MAG: bifunctional (p)ppGpp synthetase/guanosine-3',5'-bis(diphosphate) 3'-pyrophosphohydrolase [Treponema sp.]|nr:bifunctional (p)ppGpp synthetase/guanosine-3',5'-bis(diphosphate) 3'-pyrophosphohydrolase [Candidatus Treponema merdequi]
MQQEVFTENPQVLIEDFFKKFEYFDENDKQKIISAWNFLLEKTKDKTHDGGTPYYLHPYRVSLIVAEYSPDRDSIITALLHNILSFENVTEEEIKSLFGEEILKLVQMEFKISNVHVNAKTQSQANAVRNMFFALTDDMRVILIRLAERIDYMRYLKGKSEEYQKAASQEILDIWAPLADRLGIKQGKNELEDLSLKYLNPDVYQQIKAIVSQKKDERSDYLEKTKQSLYKAALKAGIEITVTARAKHFYSIYQKMKKRNKEAGELYDLLAVRILCNTNAECYTLLGIVHQLWKPLEGRFKDYIAMPKANGYQSLHTTVMAEGKPLEIQIRTNEMHHVAEHGVASHWLYKKGMTNDIVDVKNLSIVNQLQELKDEHLTDETLFAEFKNELLKDKIVVFTPNGDIIQLPEGATAVDFAYAIHSRIGETIAAAKADGKIIPLSVPLENTQIIEIITNPQNHPTENQLQYVVTYRAKQKINAWLNANKTEQAKQVPSKTEIQKTEEDETPKEQHAHKPGKRKRTAPHIEHSGKIKVGNTSNFVMTIAGCCCPKFPDEIVGYVSRGRGITVHKKDCRIYKRIPDIEHRSVDVEWE